MKKLSFLLFILVLLISPALAQKVSPRQSKARPFGLNIVNKVISAGSDNASADFQANVLPSMNRLLGSQLSEKVALKNSSALRLDPTKLRMTTQAQARVYFIGEGASYHNTLGFNTLAAGESALSGAFNDTAKLIFPDASQRTSYASAAFKKGKGSSKTPTSSRQSPFVYSKYSRTPSTPLIPGDFVDLGTFKAGETLDFFMIANGANRGTKTYTADPDRNPDKINHVVTFTLPDSPYLIIGFEDFFKGGDMDFNDLVFAVDIGAENVENMEEMVSTPEPSTYLILLTLLGFFAFWYWRQQGGGTASI